MFLVHYNYSSLRFGTEWTESYFAMTATSMVSHRTGLSVGQRGTNQRYALCDMSYLGLMFNSDNSADLFVSLVSKSQ